MSNILTRCPVCASTLGVTELTCGRCHTSIRGTFSSCRFCRTPVEHLRFIETFLRNEGNLSKVGQALGLSYPTVRNKLVAALLALGLDDESEPSNEQAKSANPDLAEVEGRDRGEASGKAFSGNPELGKRRMLVLEALADGSLSVEEAAEAIRAL